MDRSRVTVHVVDDEPAVADSLKELIESVGLRAKTYGDAQGFLDSVDAGTAGCLVLDVRLPDVSGLELQTILRDRRVQLPVILITGNGDVDMAVRGMRNGAVNFLQKPLNAQRLLESVEEALRTDDRVRAGEQTSAENARRLALLTERELQVVELVTAGHANKQIARLLGISQKTVELHRSKAMKKLGANHVAELVALVLRCGAAT